MRAGLCRARAVNPDATILEGDALERNSVRRAGARAGILRADTEQSDGILGVGTLKLGGYSL